jgi:hypothetical protein
LETILHQFVASPVDEDPEIKPFTTRLTPDVLGQPAGAR